MYHIRKSCATQTRVKLSIEGEKYYNFAINQTHQTDEPCLNFGGALFDATHNILIASVKCILLNTIANSVYPITSSYVVKVLGRILTELSVKNFVNLKQKLTACIQLKCPDIVKCIVRCIITNTHVNLSHKSKKKKRNQKSETKGN